MASFFTSKIRKEFEKNTVNLGNKFYVRIEKPSTLSEWDDNIAFRVRTVDLAARNVPTQDHKVFGSGLTRKIPYNDINIGAQNTIVLTLTQDAKLSQKILFENWMRTILNNQSGVVEYYDKIISPKMKVYIAGLDGTIVAQATYFRCFPTVVEQTTLNIESANPLDLTVTMAFEDYKIEAADLASGITTIDGVAEGKDVIVKDGLELILDDLGSAAGFVGDLIGSGAKKVVDILKSPF